MFLNRTLLADEFEWVYQTLLVVLRRGVGCSFVRSDFASVGTWAHAPGSHDILASSRVGAVSHLLWLAHRGSRDLVASRSEAQELVNFNNIKDTNVTLAHQNET